MSIRKVGILGGGKMSTEIFKLLTGFDFDLVLWTPFPEEVTQARQLLTRKLARKAQKGGPRGEAAQAKLDRMTFTTDKHALADMDLIIEAVVENIGLKRKVFAEMDKLVKPDAIFVTNTSTLSPSYMAAVTSRPERFVGLHYFYPVSLVDFVEVVPISTTDPTVTEKLQDFVRTSGKRPLLVNREVNGYLVNRLLGTYYSEGDAGTTGG